MTQTGLLLLAVAITGIYAVRWTRRLAAPLSELPFKTLLATLLSSWVALGEFVTLPLTDALLPAALILGPLYVFAPLALVGLARNGRAPWAWALTRALYWSVDGRIGLRRLLTQAALQRGDAEVAAALAPEGDALIEAQIRSLQGDWPGVLTLALPREGDNAFLGDAARVRALIATGRLDEAEGEIAAMAKRWEAQGGGPIGYRSLRLSEARLAAERGRFEQARETLQGVGGLPAHLAFAVLARAAEVRGDPAAAGRMLSQAYGQAPEGYRRRYAERLAASGLTAPRVPRRWATGTLLLVLALGLLYVGQSLLDRAAAQLVFSRFAVEPSFVAAAFALNLGFPSVDAWWRYLSYAFVHANIVHIGFNLWVLFDIGRLYEQRRGWGNVLAAFAVGTVMGAYLTQIVFGSDVHLMVGASGGVLGVAGALLADALRGRGGADRALTRGLLQWMVLIVLLSVAIPNVSLWGHVGGLVGGLLWGFIRQGLPPSRRFDLFVGVITASILLFAVLEVVRLSLTLL
jgi:membrane associated rhomboid family serine protease